MNSRCEIVFFYEFLKILKRLTVLFYLHYYEPTKAVFSKIPRERGSEFRLYISRNVSESDQLILMLACSRQLCREGSQFSF